MVTVERFREYLEKLSPEDEIEPACEGQMAVFEPSLHGRRHKASIHYSRDPRILIWEGRDKPYERIGILTTIWGRPELTQTFLDYYNRFAFAERVCVTSPEDDTADDLDYTGWTRVEHQNEPLSEKWNAGLRKFRRARVDGVMILGSDDFINYEYLERVLSMQVEAAQINGCYFYDQHTGKSMFLSQATVGAGRYLSRAALEKTKFRAWPDGASTMMDWNQTEFLRKYGIEFTTIHNEQRDKFGILDVKSGTNKWHYDHIEAKGDTVPVSKEELLKKFEVAL